MSDAGHFRSDNGDVLNPGIGTKLISIAFYNTNKSYNILNQNSTKQWSSETNYRDQNWTPTIKFLINKNGSMSSL